MPTNEIWNTTLENFRESLANSEPEPAGVSVAAVSAAFAASLLQKVLKIVAKRKSFAGQLAHLLSLCEAARNDAERLAKYAEEDMAAYRAYLEARRRKDGDLASALRNVMETPLKGARSALSALTLCAAAAEIVHGAVAADLATAAILLESTIRSMLLCVRVNLEELPNAGVAGECKQIEENAVRQLSSVLGQGMIRPERS